MIHHIHYMRDGKLHSADLGLPVSPKDLLTNPQLVITQKTPKYSLGAVVQPLEIARGMAEHARLEAERAKADADRAVGTEQMGASIGEVDWLREECRWMAEVRRLEQQ